MQPGKVLLIPSFLYEDTIDVLPPNILKNIQQCHVFFVEQEKTARRFLKKIWPEIIIDDYEWHSLHKTESATITTLLNALKSGKTAGIISEAGCPGIADPGQLLVEAAQANGFEVHPLVGPNAILLTLMASGMNGQCFQFHGYLPIDTHERKQKIKELEADSAKRNCTQLFIETPYRNNQLMNDILSACKELTKVCIGIDLTSPHESVQTKTVRVWKQQLPDIHKKLAVFALYAR